MAKLFEEIFRENGAGDIALILREDPRQQRLHCHSLILMQFPYFCKMLSVPMPLSEGRTREVNISDEPSDFIELIHFIYTGHVDINTQNVAGILTLADKYCVDEMMDMCLHFLSQNFSADVFFAVHCLTPLSTSFREKLKDQLMSALRHRRCLCLVSEDERWQDLPADFVEEILSQDDLPITSEAEVLRLIAHWGEGPDRSPREVKRMLRTVRKSDSLSVHISDLEALMAQVLDLEVFSTALPRNGSSLWDPSFVVHRHEAAGNITTTPAVAVPLTTAEGLSPGRPGETKQQLGAKDLLQQEPGWMPPGIHRCRVSFECSCWSHRERRLLRSARSSEAAALKRSAFAEQRTLDHVSEKSPGHERSPSPSSSFQVRMTPLDGRETFDIGQVSDVSDQEGRGLAGANKRFSGDKIENDLVNHHIICGIVSGSQRHGIRLFQKDRGGIYTVEDLNGKQAAHIGGTTTSVTFDLELAIERASKNNISRCRFSVLRDAHSLQEEWFDVSAKVPLRFYISSAYFDSNSMYSVHLRWLTPPGSGNNPAVGSN
mmetsp:Transcript_52402/g.125176  ORF Transcript_52402/g.125176 Transcript_52402/m.125176 type:complete len:545 (-) Transcript_52402:53-1687(-)